MGNNSEFDRLNSDSIIDERTMREIYLPAFEAAVKEANEGSVMDSYNLTKWPASHAERIFQHRCHQERVGLQGNHVSDWDATYDALGAANGGLDLEMPSGKFMNRIHPFASDPRG
jgi:beta-glucosidase